MKRIPIKLQIKMFICLMSILCCIIGIFVVWPYMQNIREMQEEIHRTQVYLEKQYQSGQNRRESMRRLTEIKQETEKFKSYTIDTGDELKVITMLEKLAGEKIEQDMSVSLPGEKDHTVEGFYTFSTVNKGGFEDLLNYLFQIEQLPYYAIIDALSWNRQQTDGSVVSLRFQTNIYAKNKKRPQ